MIQTQIAVGGEDDNLDHLGEASSIHLLAVAGVGRLISDDHGARAVSRHQRQLVGIEIGAGTFAPKIVATRSLTVWVPSGRVPEAGRRYMTAMT